MAQSPCFEWLILVFRTVGELKPHVPLITTREERKIRETNDWIKETTLLKHCTDLTDWISELSKRQRRVSVSLPCVHIVHLFQEVALGELAKKK